MMRKVAGVDEVGRGPLAGPVLAAAVILDPKKPIAGLMDSKQLSEQKRERLYIEIAKSSIAYALGSADVLEIDQLNILQASLLAMQRAVEALSIKPEQVLVDGNFCPKLCIPTQAIIKGDQKIAAISAASIIAKVTRDRIMLELDQQYPGYGFASNKGYPTLQHRQALQQLGAAPVHRRSFKPVKDVIKEHI